MHYNKYITGTACLLSMLSVSCSREKGENQEKPNVIFFIADDMTRDMFNFHEEGEGRNLSPNLDRLAREGTIMMGQHVVSPVCTPSRYNCLTGTYASRAGNDAFLTKKQRSGGQTVVEWNSFITPEDTTIGHLLQEEGYVTGFVGKNHVIKVPGIYIPGDYFADPENPEISINLRANADKFRQTFGRCGFDYAERIYDNNPNYIGLKELAVHNLDWITEGGLEFLEENKNQPFFLYFATTTPHGPYEIERSWGADRRITPYGILDNPVNLLSSEATIRQRLHEAGIDTSGADLAKRGNVLWLDDALGALIDKLKEIGEYENTIIFFFNDHGQAAKGTVYQGGTENPSIVWKYGGFDCGNETKALVSNIDFAPTILDLTGAQTGYEGFDGKSFVPVLEGDTSAIHESLYFEMGYSRGIRKDDMKYIALRYPENARNMSIGERRRILDAFNAHQIKQSKKVHHQDPSLPYSHLQLIPGGGDAEQASIKKYPAYYDRNQLYDLSEDPNEQNNLYGKKNYAKREKELQDELKKYLRDLPGIFPGMKKATLSNSHHDQGG